MKNQEAIEHLEDINLINKTRHMMRSVDDELVAGEVEEYRNRFKAVTLGIEALEKQIPMPIGSNFNECPNCKRQLANEVYRQDFCDKCGQAICWEEMK